MVAEGKKFRSVVLPEELIARATVLAKDYDVSFNKLVFRALQKAVEDWHVPGQERKEPPETRAIGREEEKDKT